MASRFGTLQKTPCVSSFIQRPPARSLYRCIPREQQRGANVPHRRRSRAVVLEAVADGGASTSELESTSAALSAHTWTWRGHKINYVVAGCGDPVLLVHGFGASVKHFRKNIPVIAEDHKVYAVDLLGFGQSAKAPVDYSMELWRDLILDFIAEFIDQPIVIVGNSVGSLATVMAASSLPEGALKGTVLLNCAGAMNNKVILDDWRTVVAYPVFLLIDFLLNIRPVAEFLFKNFSQKESIRNVLMSVYSNPDAVDDELVDIIHKPSQEKGALDVFVSVLTGPPGPRPESLIPNLQGSLLLLWGDEDPFTPIDGPVGKFFQSLPETRANTQFVKLPGVGHCPHDDRPDLVHAKLLPWLKTLPPTKIPANS